jgi:hypothetical protein
METNLRHTIAVIARYFDGCKVGYEGTEGYRKSTDLFKLAACAEELSSLGLIGPQRTAFLDLGCADGRVNILMSCFVRLSIGVEIDPEILAEYAQRQKELAARIEAAGAMLPPQNVALFHGNSLEDGTLDRVFAGTGVRFDGVDLFYTYITLHDMFAEKIRADARKGALYLVYGFSRVLPRYDGFDLVLPDVADQGIAALYRKR